jgi:hypothetical protein
MKAATHARQRRRCGNRVRYVPAVDFNPVRQVGKMTGRQIVQHTHAIATGEQRFAQMGANEAATASYQEKPHLGLMQKGKYTHSEFADAGTACQQAR